VPGFFYASRLLLRVQKPSGSAWSGWGGDGGDGAGEGRGGEGQGRSATCRWAIHLSMRYSVAISE